MYTLPTTQNNFIITFPEPEVFAPITDIVLPGIMPYYMVSTYGRIASVKLNNACMKKSLDNNGYEIISLETVNSRKTLKVHRIVMLTFKYNENYKNLEVNHIDGIHTHNWIWNLEWVTSSENTQHAMAIGLHAKGEQAVNSIFTDVEVHYICKQLELGVSIPDIVEEMKMRIYPREYSNLYGIISHIKNGYAWKHISSLYNIPHIPVDVFNEKEVHHICKCLEQRMSYDDILISLNRVNLSNSEYTKCKKSISNIKNGRTHKHISSLYNIPKGRSGQFFSEEQIHYICSLIKMNTDIPRNDILSSLGINVNGLDKATLTSMRATLRLIKQKKLFKNISDLYF